MNRITIKDIAQRAGVSIATVSRVVNGNPTVTPEIQQKVMNVIESTGYYPNQLARSLKISQSRMIGLVLADITNEYMAHTANAIDEVLRTEGYSLILCSAGNNQANEDNNLRLLMEKQVEGIIVNTCGLNTPLLAEISRSVPTVLLHRKIDAADFKGDWVDTDIYASAYDMTKMLIDCGHRRIASLNGPLRLSTGRMRYEGFRDAMHAGGLETSIGDRYFFEGDFSMKSGYDGANYFMRMENPPTAIVNMHGDSTLGMLRYFRDNHISVPDQVSVVSVSAIMNADLLYVRPYQYMIRSDVIGHRAAQLLLERIHSENSLPNREFMYSMPIVPGDSVMDLRPGPEATRRFEVSSAH